MARQDPNLPPGCSQDDIENDEEERRERRIQRELEQADQDEDYNLRAELEGEG